LPDPAGVCCGVGVAVETRRANGERLSFITFGVGLVLRLAADGSA